MGSEITPRSLDLLLSLFPLAALSWTSQTLAQTPDVRISDTNGLGVKEISQIVAQHNKLRSRVTPAAANMQKMEWVEQFAVLAKQQAALCNKDASLLHSLSFGHTGWNMHLPADGAASFSNITDDWFEEGKYFLYYSGRCRENAICQHYTQLVWATSSHVGCASQQCLRDGLLWKIFAGVYYPEDLGGTLAEIHSQKVQDILVFYVSELEASNEVTNFETRNFWIGLTYKPLRDSFCWDTGEFLRFSSFAFGQPDNQGFGNCVELQALSTFNWNDQRCKTRNRYICQHDAEQIAQWEESR